MEILLLDLKNYAMRAHRHIPCERRMHCTLESNFHLIYIQDGGGVSAEDETFEIEFNYELLDDSYTVFNKSMKGEENNLFFLDNILPDTTEYKSYDWFNMNLYDDTTDRLGIIHK